MSKLDRLGDAVTGITGLATQLAYSLGHYEAAGTTSPLRRSLADLATALTEAAAALEELEHQDHDGGDVIRVQFASTDTEPHKPAS